MIILQISPEFTPGSGVGGVAYALEKEWQSQGHDVRRFGSEEAGCQFLATSMPGLRGRLRHAGHVVWFSTIGTIRARRAVRDLPADAVAICHNDALAGDVYVNHGILTSAMRARGNFVWRMVRNPLHLVTVGRDIYRYRSRTHRAVVSLSEADRTTLVRRYGLDADSAFVIHNGVHLDRFRLASPGERRTSRMTLGIPLEARVAAFVGHEFDRKGLPLLIDAVSDLPDHHVLVIGGSPGEIDARRRMLSPEAARRIHWMGRLPDPRHGLAAADVLALPSAYEANPLVVLEALASGLQVLVTPVGSIPEMLTNDAVSRVVDRSVQGVRRGLSELAAFDAQTPDIQTQARSLAESHDWQIIATEYLDLFAWLGAHEAPRR